MCDSIIAAPFAETLEATYDEDCTKDHTKDIKNVAEIFKYNDFQSLYTAESVFPWPLKNRETCTKTAEFFDPYNRAYIVLSLTIPEGQDYLGFIAPKCKKGKEQLTVNYSVEYFQYIAPNVTRYLSIDSFDPNVTSISASNFDKMVHDDMAKDKLKFMAYPVKLLDPKFKLYSNMQKHRPTWELILTEILKGDDHAGNKPVEATG